MSSSTLDNLGYLLHHIAFMLNRKSDQVLQERLDIGFSQFKILLMLKHKSGVQQKEIASMLGQTEASVSRQIKLLHEVGLLHTQHGQGDRRQRITMLTNKGINRLDKAMTALNSYYQPLFSRLSLTEQMELKKNLLSIHGVICQKDHNNN